MLASCETQGRFPPGEHRVKETQGRSLPTMIRLKSRHAGSLPQMVPGFEKEAEDIREASCPLHRFYMCGHFP